MARTITAPRLREIGVAIRRIKREFRVSWIDKIINSSNNVSDFFTRHPSLLEWQRSLEGEEPLPLEQCWPIDDDMASKVARALHKAFVQFQKCRTEALRIRRFLRLIDGYGHSWWDFLNDAILKRTRRILELPEVGTWLERASQQKLPPNLDAIIPPVELRHLRAIRRNLDAARKRIERAKPTVQYNDAFDAFVSDLVSQQAAQWEFDGVRQVMSQSLTGRQREIIRLRYQSNLKLAEISKILRISLSSVSDSLVKAIDKLANAIREASVLD